MAAAINTINATSQGIRGNFYKQQTIDNNTTLSSFSILLLPNINEWADKYCDTTQYTGYRQEFILSRHLHMRSLGVPPVASNNNNPK